MGRQQNVDRLSNMPQEVISHILSLMPTKFAFQTSVLSRTWINCWKSVTNLDFDDQPHPLREHGFIKFVDRVLDFCKASQVQRFRLHCSHFGVRRSRVCEWIDAAVRLNVSELDVNVISFVLPHSLFTCNTLTKLSLHSTHDDGERNYPSYVNLPCLKTIDIDVLCKASVDVLNLIHGCPVLESLSLKIFDPWPSNEDYNFNIPTLKHMKLSIKKRTLSINKVVLNIPKLEDLYLETHVSTVFVMEDLSSLISVTLSNYDGFVPFWVKILKGVSGAKSLTLVVHVLLKTPSDTLMPNFPYLKLLEFNASSASSWSGLVWPLFHQILENSPELEHLCIIMKPKDQKDSPWSEPQSLPTCMLKNLKTIKFANFKGQKSNLQLLAYLLGNAEVLKMLTIKCDSLPLEEEMQLTAQLSAALLNFPRASRYCEIDFLGSRSRSTTS